MAWHFRQRTKEELKLISEPEKGVTLRSSLIAGKLLIQKLLFRLFNFEGKLSKLVSNKRGWQGEQKDDRTTWEVPCIKLSLFVVVCIFTSQYQFSRALARWNVEDDST